MQVRDYYNNEKKTDFICKTGAMPIIGPFEIFLAMSFFIGFWKISIFGFTRLNVRKGQ